MTSLRHSPRLAATLIIGASLLAGWILPIASLSRVYVPDLPLLAVIMVATRLPREEAMLLAAASGLAADTFSSATFGSRAIVFVLVAWVSGWLGERVNPSALPGRLLLAAAGVVGAEVLGILVLHLLSPGTPRADSGGLLVRVLVTACLAALIWRAPAPQAIRRPA